jgi:hypothetical protein
VTILEYTAQREIEGVKPDGSWRAVGLFVILESLFLQATKEKRARPENRAWWQFVVWFLILPGFASKSTLPSTYNYSTKGPIVIPPISVGPFEHIPGIQRGLLLHRISQTIATITITKNIPDAPVLIWSDYGA